MPVAPVRWDVELTVPTAGSGTFNYISDVAGLSNDRSVVVWSNFTTGKVYGQLINAVGDAGVAFEISGGFFSAPNAGVGVAALAGGGFVVTWNYDASATDTDVMQRRYDANGNPVGFISYASASAADQSLEDITALANGGWVVSYSDPSNGGDVRGTVFDANGSVVSGTSILLSSASIYGQAGSNLAGLSNGNFVVAYTDDFGDTDAYVRIFNSSGVVVRLAQQVNDIENGQAGTPVAQTATGVAALSNGGFVVTFTHDYDGITNTNAGDDDTYFQLYDSAGNRVGSNVAINTSSQRQYDTDVTGLPDGSFVVTYSDRLSEGGASANITADIYSNTGAFVGRLNNINTTTSGSQLFSQVSALSDGRYIVTWTDFGNGEVRYEIFDSRDSSILGNSNDGGNNVIIGRTGNSADIIYGFGGNDTLTGGGGNDQLIGGSGDDTVDFSYDAALGGFNGVYVDLGGGAALDGFGSYDTLNSIENVIGTNSLYPGFSPYSDLIFGSSGANVIQGLGGNDYIEGFGGIDSLFGQTGNDIISGGDGADTIVFGTGNDYVFGGNGTDSFYIQNADVRAGDYDTIVDFVAGQDIFAVSSSLAGQIGVYQASPGVVLMYAAAAGGTWYQQVYGTGVTAAAVSAAFYFV
jgi:RTX calcium-binding nonapeptide repeat (4 copies)